MFAEAFRVLDMHVSSPCWTVGMYDVITALERLLTGGEMVFTSCGHAWLLSCWAMSTRDGSSAPLHYPLHVLCVWDGGCIDQLSCWFWLCMFFIMLESGHTQCYVMTSHCLSHAPCGWWIPAGEAGHGQAHLSHCCNMDTHEVVSCPFTVKHMLRVDGGLISHHAGCGCTWLA